MSLRQLLTDTVTVVSPGGDSRGTLKASVQGNKVFIFDVEVPVEEGGKILRQLRSGLQESFAILQVSFTDLALGGQGKRFAQTLLMKRQAFAHEDEVRLLAWISGDQTRARIDPIDRGLFRVPIDPHALVDEVLVDPRLLPTEAEALIRRVRLTGYSGPVHQSELYKFTPRAIRLS